MFHTTEDAAPEGDVEREIFYVVNRENARSIISVDDFSEINDLGVI